MPKSVNISWTDFVKALGLNLSQSPLEDYGGIDFAYETGNQWIHDYQLENEVELSEDAKQEIIDEFSMSIEAHWSIPQIMQYNFPLDTWVDKVNAWSKRGPQMSIYDRNLIAGTAIMSSNETDDGVEFMLDEPFLIAYAEAAYAVHGVGDEGYELGDMGGEEVARVMGWIGEAEGHGIENSLNLDDWDRHWQGPNYKRLRDIASAGTVAQNTSEDGGPSMTVANIKKTAAKKQDAPPLNDKSMDDNLVPYVPTHLQKWTSADPIVGTTGNYMGTRWDDYYVGPARTRDSEVLEQSNFDVTLRELGGESDPEVVVAGTNHWAVGWVDRILVHKDAYDKLRILDAIAEKLEDYPVLDEEDFSEREWKEREDSFESWGRKEIEDIFEDALPEAVFEAMKADEAFERIALQVFMDTSAYHGETTAPTTLKGMAAVWGDINPDLQESYAYKVMDSVISGGPINEDEPGSEGLSELIRQNPQYTERIMKAYHGGKGTTEIQKLVNELKIAEDPTQMKMFENEKDIIDTKAQFNEDVDWEAEMYNQEPKGSFDIDAENVGTWVAHDTPDIGDRVQQYAKKFGWDGVIMTSDDDGYYDAVQDAENFLNSKAPMGYFFGTDDEGNWGMWEGVAEPVENPELDIDQEGKDEAELIAAPEEVEEKDVTELTEADMPPQIATRRYGSTVQRLMAIRAAQIDPAKIQWTKEGDDAVSKDDVGKVISKVPWADFERDNPEIAGKLTIAGTLEKLSILSEFHDDLYPRIDADIDVGSKVFIKPIKRFGEVVRTLDEGGAFRVQAGDKINTYFRQELEVRQASK